MKAKILNGKAFEPIVIELTIESLDNLNNLFNRLTLMSNIVREESDLNAYPSTCYIPGSDELWQIIKHYAVERNKS